MIKLNKIAKIAQLSYENALRLHFDSISLFKLKSYSTAYFLSVISLEEFGKFCGLEDYYFDSAIMKQRMTEPVEVDGKLISDPERKFIELIYQHKIKQQWFLYFLDFKLPQSIISEIKSGSIERKKQNALYVGLRKINKTVDLKSKIINPLAIKKNYAKDQITIMNDNLLVFTLGVSKGVYGAEIQEVEASLKNRKVFNKLINEWKYVKPSTKRKLNKIMQIK